MKDSQRSFLSGLFIGSFGILPLILWLSEIRIKFRCPTCDAPITVQKRKTQLIPELSTDLPEEIQRSSDDDSSETSDLFIATAPTV